MNHPELATTRRTFLQAAAATGGALVAAATVGTSLIHSAERTHSNKGRIFIANKGGGIGGTVEEITQVLNDYKRFGYDGIEGGSPDIKDIRAARRASRQTRIPIHGVVDGVHWEIRLSSPDQKVREDGRDKLIQAIKDSHALGGSTVLLVPGRVSGNDENHDHVWHRSIEQIRQVLPTAARYGIRVLIENVWNGFCETPEQYRDYIDAIGSPWVGAYFDIGNCRKFGPAENWIRTLGKRIVKLDVKDWGKANSFCKIGTGDVNWPEVRKALAEIEFTGWATREGGEDGSHETTVSLMQELLDL